MTAPPVSVVVPTRDRPDRLDRCLAALGRQTGVASLEVVVVDDGSADADAVRAVVGGHGHARLVRRGGAGPAAARNVGAREATAAVLCFTDDDCVPLSDWAARLAGAVADGVDAAGGVTQCGDPADPYAQATETILDYLQRRARRPHGFFVPSSNLACRRELLLELPFDETFPSASGEDRDWCARLLASGGRLVIEPAAVVRHFPPTGPRSFWRQHTRYGRGAYRLARTRVPPVALQPSGFYVGLVRAGFARGLRCGLLVGLAQAASAVGFAAEAWATRGRQ